MQPPPGLGGGSCDRRQSLADELRDAAHDAIPAASVSVTVESDREEGIVGDASGDDKVLAGFGSEAAGVAARVERRCQSATIVQPSGQPIRRSVSSGVSRLGIRSSNSVAELPVVGPDGAGDDVTGGDGLRVGGPPVMPEVVEGPDDVVSGVVVSDALAFSGEDCARDISIASISGGRDFPRFEARRRMPWAAVADRKNLSGALSSRIEANVDSDDEHPSSPLRHSEVASVENAVSPQVPEFRHRTLEGIEVPTGMAGEKSRNVLEEDDPGSISPHKLEEGVGES
jgi:hypothetical protein